MWLKILYLWIKRRVMKDKYNSYCHVEQVKEYTAEDIKNIRKKTGTSQGFLAKWLGVSKKTVQAWESGMNVPNGPSARLLSLLENESISVNTFILDDKI